MMEGRGVQVLVGLAALTAWFHLMPSLSLRGGHENTGVEHTVVRVGDGPPPGECPLMKCLPAPSKCPKGSTLGFPKDENGCEWCETCLDATTNLAVPIPYCYLRSEACLELICREGEVPLAHTAAKFLW